ncbi:hypothetical protein ACFQ4A_10010 [Lentibacillus salinarum]|uniref:Transposase n=1 Tax=Lentibacillus salinarum TaxID=446820 RepID=A0ABW3ZUS8_9BACI
MTYTLKQKNNLSTTGVGPFEMMVHQALKRLIKRLIKGQVRAIEGTAGELPSKE